MRELLKKLKKEGVFWSYDDLKIDENSLIEHILKYGDFDDIIKIVKIYGKEKIKKVWDKKMKYDKRFKKINILIARVFLDLDISAKDLENGYRFRNFNA